MRTLYVNLYGGPGAGKSHQARGLTNLLMSNGVHAEYVSEYAKMLVWGEDRRALANQVLVTATQFDWLLRMEGKVDVVVTDSPVLLGLVYPGVACTDNWRNHVWDMHKHFHNVNIYLARNRELQTYDVRGRMQDEDTAYEKDQEIIHLLRDQHEPYHLLRVTDNVLDDLYRIVVEAHENLMYGEEETL